MTMTYDEYRSAILRLDELHIQSRVIFAEQIAVYDSLMKMPRELAERFNALDELAKQHEIVKQTNVQCADILKGLADQ